jgi:glycosyltransferase involved in cell wall biosynthesis
LQPSGDWLARFRSEVAPADRFLVTQVARLTRWKGQLDFIDLIAVLRSRGVPVLGLMVGGADPRRAPYRAALERAIAARGLGAMLRVLGDRDDVREILAVSDAAVCLTREPEAFGRTTLEALTLGTPVVGYAHGATVELLSALYPEGLVDVGAIGTAADRLEALCRTRARVPRHDRYTLGAMCAGTLAVYTEVAAARRQGQLGDGMAGVRARG